MADLLLAHCAELTDGHCCPNVALLCLAVGAPSGVSRGGNLQRSTLTEHKGKYNGQPKCSTASCFITAAVASTFTECTIHHCQLASSKPDIPVPVAFVNVLLLLVELCCQAVDALQNCPPHPQPHCAAHVLSADLRHEDHCRVRGAGVELCTVCIRDANNIAGKLNDSHLRSTEHQAARKVTVEGHDYRQEGTTTGRRSPLRISNWQLCPHSWHLHMLQITCY